MVFPMTLLLALVASGSHDCGMCRSIVEAIAAGEDPIPALNIICSDLHKQPICDVLHRNMERIRELEEQGKSSPFICKEIAICQTYII